MLISRKNILACIAMISLIMTLSCSGTKKNIKYSKRQLPASSSVAVIIDSNNNLKNAVMAKFLTKGFSVKAINASDLYQYSDVFDIKDLKKLSYSASASEAGSLLAMQKSYNNIYKLHFYNFEINKAELLGEMRNKGGVDYLVLLDLKDWEKVSWGRIIDLKSYDIVWLENYPTRYSDDVDSIMDHFIKSMTGN